MSDLLRGLDPAMAGEEPAAPGTQAGGGAAQSDSPRATGDDLRTGAVRAPREVSDGTLLARARDGDLQAFELLLRRHEPTMSRVASRILGDRHAAQDVVQEALLASWSQLGSFRGDAPFGAWLYRIVVHRASAAAGRRRYHLDIGALEAGLPAATGSDDPERVVQIRQMAEALGGAVGRLTPEQRTCWVLRELEGLSYEEVASVTGTSVATVRGRLARARTTVARSMRAWR